MLARRFYKLEEAAKELHISVDDLLHLAENGEIMLSVFWSGPYAVRINGGWQVVDSEPLSDFVNIDKEYAVKLLASPYIEEEGGVEIPFGRRQDGQEVNLWRPYHPIYDKDTEHDPEKTIYSPAFPLEKILILVEEFERVRPSIKKHHQEALNKVVANTLLLGLTAALISHSEKNTTAIADTSVENGTTHDPSQEDYGEKIPGWRKISAYLECSEGTAKNRCKGRRWKNKNVIQGGNEPGGVWAWSKALDYIKANPGSTKRKKSLPPQK